MKYATERFAEIREKFFVLFVTVGDRLVLLEIRPSRRNHIFIRTFLSDSIPWLYVRRRQISLVRPSMSLSLRDTATVTK